MKYLYKTGSKGATNVSFIIAWTITFQVQLNYIKYYQFFVFTEQYLVASLKI